MCVKVHKIKGELMEIDKIIILIINLATLGAVIKLWWKVRKW